MELSQQLLAVGLVLALLFLAAKAAGRRGWLRARIRSRSRPARELEIIERLNLTPRHQLHLMRVDGQTLLIATHPQGVQIVPVSQQASAAGGHS